MAAQENAQQTLEDNKALVRRWFEEVLNHEDFQVFDNICAVCHPQMLLTGGGGLGDIPGMEGAKQQIRVLRKAFPDIVFKVEEQIAEGYRVVTRISARATHAGEFQGVPPTGKQVNISGVSIWTVGEGQLIQEQVIVDRLAMLEQLGLLAAPGQGAA